VCILVLTGFVEMAHGDEVSSGETVKETTASNNGKPLEPLQDLEQLLKELQNLSAIPVDERSKIAKKILAFSQKALGQVDSVSEQTIQKCYDGSTCLSSYSFSSNHLDLERLSLCQKIIADCLPYLDAMSLNSAMKVVGQMSACYDLQGQDLTASTVGAYRNIYLRYHLRVWERVAALPIDPTWHPNDPSNMVAGSMPPPCGKYIAGMPPEYIKEPEIRKKYEAMLEANHKKALRNSEQWRLRWIQEGYLLRLKRSIVHAYEMQPVIKVSPEDFEILKAYLRIYVSDEKLRKELFELAQSTVLKWKGVDQAIGEKNYAKAKELADYILHYVALEEDRQKTMLVYGRIVLALGEKKWARRYLDMLANKKAICRTCQADPQVLQLQLAIYREWLSALEGKPDKAIQGLEKILAEAEKTPAPSVAEAADVLAMLYRERGELDKAKKTVDFGLNVLRQNNIKSGYLFMLLHNRTPSATSIN
jgi:hypothetical protein